MGWWQAQDERSGVADQAGGDADEAVSQGSDHGLPSRTPQQPWAVEVGYGGDLCNQSAMLVAINVPHIQAVLTWGYPDGRWRNAAPCLASRNILDRGAVPVPVLHRSGLVRGTDVEVSQ